MNFIDEFKKGQAGKNKGLYLGKGLQHVHDAINGVQKGMIYAVGAGPKVGKSTMVDYGFVIEPYLDALENNIPLDILYFSYEIDRVSKEFDFMAHFLQRDYNIFKVPLVAGTKDGKKEVPLSATYLRGRMQDDEGDAIFVHPDLMEPIRETYAKRIIPLFGEYAQDGTQISKGLITFYPNRENPTGLRNHIIDYAKENGEFIYNRLKDNKGKEIKQIIGYIPSNPDKYVIIVTDHLRKLKPERGFQMKQTVDKYVEYSVELRNFCQFTFVHIIHLNRSLADPARLRFAKDMLYPNGDDFKDTGNLSEEADYVFTMMNPNDGRYNLRQHFGLDIKDEQGNEFFPDMRTIHLVDSRHVYFPLHFRVNMYGGVKNFELLNLK
jgi:hypothetical protein